MKRTLTLLLASLAVFAITVGVAGAASSPTVSTGGASNIKNTSATLNGSLNPNGAATQYFFVYGPTTAYGGSTTHHNAGSGTRTVAVHLTASKLLPGTTYHFKLIAQNALGTTSGADRTFKTHGHPAPGVVTGGVTNVSAFGGTLTGTVIPNGQTTSWYFQYSAGAPFVSTPTGTVSGSSGPTNVSAPVGGLAPGFLYQYRLVGVHGGTASYGPFQVFSTFPLVRPFPPAFKQSTTPSRVRSKPFVFTTTGSLTPSSRFATAGQCTGNAFVRYFVGKRLVSVSRAPIQSNCTYRSVVVFTHTFAIGGKRPSTEQLRVEVRFGGNGYLAPTVRPRVGHVVLG